MPVTGLDWLLVAGMYCLWAAVMWDWFGRNGRWRG